MSYYTTGTSFSLKTGTPLPRVIYNNNGITSSRTSGVIAPTDPQTNGPASTSVFMELAIDSKGTVDAEQLAREFVDKIEPHYSSVGSISQPHLSTSMLLLNLQAMPPLPNFIRIAAYNGGYIASDASSFYINNVSSGPSGQGSFFNTLEFGGYTGSNFPLNSIDCSSNGSKIVGINSLNEKLYFSTDSGKSFTPQSMVKGNYNQVRMTSDGNYFTVLDADGKIYFYNINNITTPSIRDWFAPLAPIKTYPVKDELRCLCMSSDGSKQFVFDQSGVIWTLSVNTTNIGTTNPLTGIIESTRFKISDSSFVVWDSCACSGDGIKQTAVGFNLINGVYDCYIFLIIDAFGTFEYKKVTRRVASGINYTQERASGTASFMSSDGSKKWCIIDDQLYYNNTDYVNNFVLVSKPNDFISYGTCSPDGSIVYLIKKDGSLQTMAIP